MKRLMILPLMAAASVANAQPADPHAHHQMPAPNPAPQPSPAPDPHAHHRMPAAEAAPTPPPAADPHAHHHMAASEPAPAASSPPPAGVPATLADGVWGAAAMARSRDVLKAEHGGMTFWNVVLDRLEARPAGGADGYAWEGWARYGGDVDRFVVTSEGEGRHGVEAAEIQGLYSHAVGPYFDVQAGVRQDVEPRRRTYATVGVSGLAPYWFEVGAAAFLSDKGKLSARLEADYDLRLTNRLILQPSVEANLADESSAEVGLRLRYDIRREFAPYVGVHHEKTFGGASDTRAVVGLRLAY